MSTPLSLGRHRPQGWRASNRQGRRPKPPLRTRAAHNTLMGGLVIGGFLFVFGLMFIPGDRALEALAHRLEVAGVATTAHDAEVWHACTHKGCTGDDHVRALVELPDGEQKVLLHGSSATTDDLPEDEWSPATEDTGYAGTLDVLYDAASSTPVDTVMTAADVRSWTRGDDAGTVTVDVVIVVVGGLMAALSGLGLAWRAGFRLRRDLRPHPKGRHALLR